MAFARVIAQAKPAHAKTPEKTPRPAAQRTAMVLSHLKFIRPFSLDSKTGLGQWKSPSLD
jgi:hypothetical protein